MIGVAPDPPFDVKTVLSVSYKIPEAEHIEPSLAAVHQRQAPSLRLLEQAANSHGAQLVVPLSELCDARTCRVEQDGKLLYADEDHLSAAGATLLSGLFQKVFKSESLATRTPQNAASTRQ